MSVTINELRELLDQFLVKTGIGINEKKVYAKGDDEITREELKDKKRTLLNDFYEFIKTKLEPKNLL